MTRGKRSICWWEGKGAFATSRGQVEHHFLFAAPQCERSSGNAEACSVPRVAPPRMNSRARE